MTMQVHQLNKQKVLKDMEQRRTQCVNPPFYYHFHLHGPCNQKCIMCRPDGRHPSYQMPFEEFTQFMEKVGPYAEHITLIGGETLLYPWISEAIALLAEKKVAVSICTNATLLSEELVSQLMALRELNLRSSIDAATADTYLKIRGTNRFEQATANMRRFSEMTKERPELKHILTYVVMRENLHEVLPFIALAKSIGPHEIQFHPVRHVDSWTVENGTGWRFRGEEQTCPAFKSEYNETMARAAQACRRAGLKHEARLLQ